MSAFVEIGIQKGTSIWGLILGLNELIATVTSTW